MVDLQPPTLDSSFSILLQILFFDKITFFLGSFSAVLVSSWISTVRHGYSKQGNLPLFPLGGGQFDPPL